MFDETATLGELREAHAQLIRLHAWAQLAEVIGSTSFDGMTIEQADAFVRAALTQNQYDLLVMRFGLRGEHWVTLDQAAKTMSISRERVRAWETKAIIKIRSALHKEREAQSTPDSSLLAWGEHLLNQAKESEAGE